MLDNDRQRQGESTVKYIGMIFAMCMCSAAIGAVLPASVPPTAQAAAPPVPAMDAAVVKDGEFESTEFKFHYQLPTGWKALDDAKRVAANQQLRDQYAHPVHNPSMPASKKQPPKVETKTDPIPLSATPKRLRTPGIPNNFSLMVASPDGVESADSAVLPRINIWANHRIPAIDTPKARALVLETLGQVMEPTTLVSLAGREFARVEVRHADGIHHALWVTAAGDYLIGFELRSKSESELKILLETLRSVRFD
jgi:hypothetical protein